MGVKSAKQNEQGYKVNGLIFPSIVTFYTLKAIENNFYDIVKNEPSNYFDDIKKK